MSKHEDAVRLRHMLEHAREAVALMQDKSRSDLENSRLHALALIQTVTEELPPLIAELEQIVPPQDV